MGFLFSLRLPQYVGFLWGGLPLNQFSLNVFCIRKIMSVPDDPMTDPQDRWVLHDHRHSLDVREPKLLSQSSHKSRPSSNWICWLTNFQPYSFRSFAKHAAIGLKFKHFNCVPVSELPDEITGQTQCRWNPSQIQWQFMFQLQFNMHMSLYLI